MGKAKILASTVSTGGPLADGTIAASEVTGLAAVATSGSYADLGGTPVLAAVATSGSYADLGGTPALATVATSGSYNDLSNKPAASPLPGLELIAVHTFGGALTYNVENFSSTYDDYLILVDNVASASTAAFSARLKVGGSYQTTSTYRMHATRLSSASATYTAWNTSTLPYITISASGAVVPNRGTFVIQALGVNNTSRYPMIFWQGSFSDASNLYTVSGSADIPVTGALQGIQFMANAGDTINVGGIARVYGYKKSV